MSEKQIEMKTIEQLQEVSFLNKGLANLSKLFIAHKEELDPVSIDAIEYYISNAQTKLAEEMKSLTDTLA